MSRADSLRSELVRLQQQEAVLRKGLAAAEELARRARAEAAKKRSSALRATSETARRTNTRAAEAQEMRVTTAEKKISDLACQGRQQRKGPRHESAQSAGCRDAGTGCEGP